MRKNVLEYLESSARMHADKPAFCDENRVFTFGELLKAAQSLGTHLAKTVDTLHKPVAVLIGRTAESVAAMQGVLYAGGCYVPIDNHMPEARIRRIFEQVHPVAIVYAEGNRKQAEPLADCAPLISMDEGFAAPADADLLQSIRESVLDIDPVYLLFTSGSTGAPKGIVIPHRAVIDFTDWMSEFCGYTEHDIFGNQAPFYFDLSCKDLYQTLSLGATCHIFSKKLFTFPMLLLKEMERVGVTAINWATSAFHFVASSGALSKCAPPTLRKAALGGEALQARYVNAWKAAIPGLEVVNMYGPTETTVDCAAFHLTRDYRDDEAIPIGKACRNMQIILLDGGEALQARYVNAAIPGLEVVNMYGPTETTVDCAAFHLTRGDDEAIPSRADCGKDGTVGRRARSTRQLAIGKRRTNASSRTRQTRISAIFCTAQAILPSRRTTVCCISCRGRTDRSSTWATASSLARSRPRCTAWTASPPQPACSTAAATASSASTRANRMPRHSRVPCAGWCPSICCPTSTKSWTHCR